MGGRLPTPSFPRVSVCLILTGHPRRDVEVSHGIGPRPRPGHSPKGELREAWGQGNCS